MHYKLVGKIDKEKSKVVGNTISMEPPNGNLCSSSNIILYADNPLV